MKPHPSPPSRRSLAVRPFLRGAAAALLAAAAANALSLPSPLMIGHYDFGYASYGDPQVRPVQVFDDGAGTLYFQVRPGEPMPAVFAGPELSLLLTQPQGTYFTARSSATEFMLALGNARAVVVRALEGQRPATALRSLLAERGAASPPAMPRPVAAAWPGLPADSAVSRPPGAPSASAVDGEPAVWRDQPVLFATGSAGVGEEVRAALAALVDRIGPEPVIEVQGLGDLSPDEPLARRRAEALRDALVESGVPAGRIRIGIGGGGGGAVADAAAPGAARRAAGQVRWRVRRELPASPTLPAEGLLAASAGGVFEIRRTDQTIAGALRRWGARAGYAVAWESPLDAPLTGDLRIEAESYLDAVQQVVRGLQAQGYPIRAQAAGDRVIRFTGIE